METSSKYGGCMKIELYIESMNVIIEGKNPYYNTAAGKGIVGMWHGRTDDCQSVKKGYFNISEKENKIKNELETIAKSHGIKLKIFDISKTLHALRALIKGVHVTPTVIVNAHNFEDDIDANEILKCLGLENKSVGCGDIHS
jgi:hypothetical protein